MKNIQSRVLLAIISICLLICLSALAGAADTGDPPGRVARLSYILGNVSLQPSGEDQWSAASTNYTVTTGDRLFTDANSKAELEMGDFALRMSQSTDLTITNLTDQLLQIGVGQGSFEVTVFRLAAANSVEIDTPNGALALQRAGSYRVDVSPQDGTTFVTVNSGSAEVTGGGASPQTIASGQAAQLKGSDTMQFTLASMPSLDDFDRWCADRDRTINTAASSKYVDPYTPGVEDLDTYGRWSEVPDYGPVWYPSSVAVGWAPYRVGHWAWVEPWGWTWVSHEPWGFAPYHYGRWAVIGGTWGWVPGPVAVAPVYAPALVAFVGGDGFSLDIGLQAWFPLGPREPYLPWYHHGDNYLRQVNLANARGIDVRHITEIDVSKFKYVNQRVAITAVPTSVFGNGQGVSKKMVRITSDQIARAQVVDRPQVTPSEIAAFRGAPPTRLPKVTPAIAGLRPARPTPAVVTRNIPRPTPGPSAPPSARPHFVTRNAPPPQDVPFARRQPVLASQPGHPLEPQQRANLRQGRPAGPPKDKPRGHGSNNSQNHRN